MKERDDAMGRYCSSKECVQMGLWLVTFNVVLNIWPRHKQIVAIDTDWEIHNITRYTITLEIKVHISTQYSLQDIDKLVQKFISSRYDSADFTPDKINTTLPTWAHIEVQVIKTCKQDK